MSKNILIIDDDIDVLEILETALDYEGFRVVSRQVADDYETILREKEIDLVIIDYLLQGVNGGEICHRIKSSAEFGHLPVIIYSASSKILQSHGYYGCDTFIPKPFDLSDIVSHITKLLHCSSNNVFTK